MKIISMDETSVSAVALLEKKCFFSPWSENSLFEELGNPQAHFLICETDDVICGYIGAQEICGECYITNICVLPEHRRRGIAKALLAEAENGARSRNCEFITLEVRKSNEPAVELYLKSGYKIVGERKKFYTLPCEDALIMTKFF